MVFSEENADFVIGKLDQVLKGLKIIKVEG
jgi:hypothetical protein